MNLVDLEWGLAKPDVFPEDSVMVGWIEQTLSRIGLDEVAVSVRMMDASEITALNEAYRKKAAPTNVLSFPASDDDETGRRLLGDIAVCTEVIQKEAFDQHKTVDAHTAHMLVHGVLHLAGYDHGTAAEAQAMEDIEKRLLADFGYSDPYELATGDEGESQ